MNDHFVSLIFQMSHKKLTNGAFCLIVLSLQPNPCKNTHKRRSSIQIDMTNLLMKMKRNQVGKLLEMMFRFSWKILVQSPKMHFYPTL